MHQNKHYVVLTEFVLFLGCSVHSKPSPSSAGTSNKNGQTEIRCILLLQHKSCGKMLWGKSNSCAQFIKYCIFKSFLVQRQGSFSLRKQLTNKDLIQITPGLQFCFVHCGFYRTWEENVPQSPMVRNAWELVTSTVAVLYQAHLQTCWQFCQNAQALHLSSLRLAKEYRGTLGK